jgi:hypothetical protein
MAQGFKGTSDDVIQGGSTIATCFMAVSCAMKKSIKFTQTKRVLFDLVLVKDVTTKWAVEPGINRSAILFPFSDRDGRKIAFEANSLRYETNANRQNRRFQG